MTDLDEPNTKSGYCPVCTEYADIWAEGKWHCSYCNWSGIRPVYEVHKSVIERMEGR